MDSLTAWLKRFFLNLIRWWSWPIRIEYLFENQPKTRFIFLQSQICYASETSIFIIFFWYICWWFPSFGHFFYSALFNLLLIFFFCYWSWYLALVRIRRLNWAPKILSHQSSPIHRWFLSYKRAHSPFSCALGWVLKNELASGLFGRRTYHVRGEGFRPCSPYTPSV